MLTCDIGRQHSMSSGPLLRCSGQQWRPASAEQARRSPGPVQQGVLWVGVNGGVCDGHHHHQEEEGERGGERTRSALKESKASAVR